MNAKFKSTIEWDILSNRGDGKGMEFCFRGEDSLGRDKNGWPGLRPGMTA